MKKVLFTTLLLTFALTGCNKQSDESETALPPGQKSEDIIHFEVADQKVGHFLDQLESSKTTIEERTQILCKDFPDVYLKEYVPALQKISPENTQAQLKADLEKVLQYYKEKDQISC